MNTLSAQLFRGAAFLACLCAAAAGTAQDNRSIDGTSNNASHPSWGSVASAFTRWAPACYGDSISAPGGATRANPRVISNALFAQDAPLSDDMGLSDFCWVFGQFIDHDITLSPEGNENLFITVPRGDSPFDPFNTGAVLIPMKRNLAVAGTGTSVDNPREHRNDITAFIDGSSVYGSTQDAADWLRSFTDGKMKVSAGNLLPYNTVDLSASGDLDPQSPHMENANPFVSKLFVAGDVRANENPLLLSLHTLFVREHNRLCDVLAAEHPTWNDEELYQAARKINGGILQSIAYNEWLPAMGLRLPDYTGYDPSVNPAISNSFAAAAFRMGHTLLNGQIRRLNPDGTVHPDGHLGLRDAFFNPALLEASGGLDPFFKGMAEQTQQQFDAHLLDDVRNFLFGPPGRGGLDLAALNINRGRERGLIDYNGFRESLGLSRVAAWSDVIADPALISALQSVYPSVDSVDAWVGMLAEDAMPGKLFGPAVNAAMTRQFTALRDGDRYFYLNDPALDADKRAVITATRLADVIRRNTNVDIMQSDVFSSMPHGSVPVCMAAGPAATLDVTVALADGRPVNRVEVRVNGMDDYMPKQTTTATGVLSFPDLPTCDDYTVEAIPVSQPLDAVTAFDLYLIGQHLLRNRVITDPYQLVAADANRSGRITAFDLTTIRRVILRLDPLFQGNPDWRTFDASVVPGPNDDPLNFDWAEQVVLPLYDVGSTAEFVLVKIGDVDNSLNPAFRGIRPRGVAEVVVEPSSDASATYTVELPKSYIAADLTLVASSENRMVAVEGLDPDSYVLRADGTELQLSVFDDEQLPNFRIRLQEDGATEPFSLTSNGNAVAYRADGAASQLTMNIESSAVEVPVLAPNPMTEVTQVILPSSFEYAGTQLRIFGVTGALLLEKELTEAQVFVHRTELPMATSGDLTWSIERDGELLHSGILLLTK